jgi:predicted TIM-barrel fold metal-dependent hydrolase
VCREAHVPALFHCAADEFSAPALLGQVAADYPEVPIILAHMNMFGRAQDAIAVAERHANVYLDTSWVRPERVLEAVRRVGADKVLWGTDAPLGGIGHYQRDRALEYLRKHAGTLEYEAVTWSNAACLFCLE